MTTAEMTHKIRVTPQQRANAIEARDVMWPSVPPENVARHLDQWRTDAPSKKIDCGTHACFGGWCAVYPTFVEQGVSANADLGAPVFRNVEDDCHRPKASKRLFGATWLFAPRESQAVPYAEPSNVSDHAIVTHRLNWLIENSMVAK